MLFKRLRIALLVCSLVAFAGLTVRADDKAADDKAPEKAPEKIGAPTPAPAAAGDCGAPAYKTVCVTEWVPETYTGTPLFTNANASRKSSRAIAPSARRKPAPAPARSCAA